VAIKVCGKGRNDLLKKIGPHRQDNSTHKKGTLRHCKERKTPGRGGKGANAVPSNNTPPEGKENGTRRPGKMNQSGRVKMSQGPRGSSMIHGEKGRRDGQNGG